MCHARSSHQTLRTSTVYINYRFFKEKGMRREVNCEWHEKGDAGVRCGERR